MADDELDLYDALSSGNTDLLTFFFHLLWKKGNVGGGPVGGSSGVAAGGTGDGNLFRVQIPDTVIMHHSRVLAWYFTAKDGTIKKKSHKRLNTENMLRVMKAKAKSVSGCACSLSQTDIEAEDGFSQRFTPARQLASLVSDDCSGVLQTFIDPKEERSGQPNMHLVVGTWTPNVFFVERRINSSLLNNDKLTLAQRCTTADTDALVRIAPLVSARTTKLLEHQCVAVAQRIESAFRYRVVGLTLHFLCDEADVPWLLRCTSLRIVHSTNLQRSVTVTLGQLPVAGGGSKSTPPHQQQPKRRQPAVLRTPTSPTSSTGREEELRRRRSVLVRPRAYSEVSGFSSDSGRRLSKASYATGSPASLQQQHSANRLFGTLLTTNDEDETKDDDEEEELMTEQPQVDCALCGYPLVVPPDPFEEGASSSRDQQLMDQHSSRHEYSAIPLKHVLFPLSVLEFYQQHPPGTFFQQIWDPEDEDIPSHVRLLFPALLSTDYAVLRDDSQWLSQPVPLCEPCRQGFLHLTEAIQIRPDGSIQYPFGQGRVAPTMGDMQRISRHPIPKAKPSTLRASSVSPARQQRRPEGDPNFSTPQPASKTRKGRKHGEEGTIFQQDVSPYVGRADLKKRLALPAIDANPRTAMSHQ